ncbi:hypothetical protein [Vibrio breoganii]|uniref:hypothetical protein n=1 Tax=Vibrio breoganii TaxID=553239 RepID=UPI000C8166DC|nr:hypothetical protein [Vibrio breoganii]PMG93284.1 hypothetical protein BCU80_08610 [Vibrio breoganii]
MLMLMLATILLLLSGCATYKVDNELNKQFVDKSVPKGKTAVYVVRGSNFVGGGRGLWVAMNDEVVADLSNGSHVYLEIDSGVNTLAFVQGLAGLAYIPLDYMDQQTAFVRVDYTSKQLATIIEPDLGKTMVLETSSEKPLDTPRVNDAYDNLMLNPGNIGYDLMKTSNNDLKANSESALVTFYRPDDLINNVKFDIWSGNEYIGSTTGGSYFSVQLKPGEYNFISRSERFSVLKANIEANKEYAIELDVGMGWNQAHIKLLPINLNASNTVSLWKKSLVHTEVDTDVLNNKAVKHRIEQGEEYIEEFVEKIKNGELPSRDLPADFGKQASVSTF